MSKSKLTNGAKIFIGSDIFYYSSIYFLDIFLVSLVTLNLTSGNLKILGFIISYAFIIRALSELLALRLIKVDKNKHKKSLITYCSVLGGLLIILLGFSFTVWHVVVIYALITVLTAISYPYRWGIFTTQFDKKVEDKAWGYEDIITSLFLGVFSALLGVIANMYGLITIFVILGLSYIVSGLMFLFIKMPKKHHFWFLR